MNEATEQELKRKAEGLFGDAVGGLRPHEVEWLYQGFKARLMYELGIRLQDGIMTGDLEQRKELKP